MTDAQEMGRQIEAAVRLSLEQSGHGGCSMLSRAEYSPGVDGEYHDAAVCGCGAYAEMPGGLAAALAPAVPAEQPPGPPAVGGAEQIVTPTLELVDPSAILTPDDLSAHILDVVNRLERGALFAMQCIAAEFEARRSFKMAMAKHVATSTAGSADRRDAEAMVACEETYNEMVTAEMLARVARESLHNLRSILSGYQTTGRAVMAVYGAGGSPSGQG